MKKTLKKTPLLVASLSFILFATSCNKVKESSSVFDTAKKEVIKPKPVLAVKSNTIDTADYNKRMLALANNDTTGRWPAKGPYPLAGAILPYNRIIAYYGNLYSKRMGILGELPRAEMLKKLQSEVAKWQAADSTVKAIPALHYIAITAKGAPGKGNLNRMRLHFYHFV